MTPCSQVSQLVKGLLSGWGFKQACEVNLCCLSLIVSGTVSHKFLTLQQGEKSVYFSPLLSNLPCLPLLSCSSCSDLQCQIPDFSLACLFKLIYLTGLLSDEFAHVDLIFLNVFLGILSIIHI